MREINAYHALMTKVHESKGYREASFMEKDKMDSWLGLPEVVRYFGERVVRVPENVQEVIILRAEESDSYNELSDEGRRIVSDYLRNSESFKGVVGSLEEELRQFF